jgi:hypothetical protein
MIFSFISNVSLTVEFSFRVLKCNYLDAASAYADTCARPNGNTIVQYVSYLSTLGSKI